MKNHYFMKDYMNFSLEQIEVGFLWTLCITVLFVHFFIELPSVSNKVEKYLDKQKKA